MHFQFLNFLFLTIFYKIFEWRLAVAKHDTTKLEKALLFLDPSPACQQTTSAEAN